MAAHYLNIDSSCRLLGCMTMIVQCRRHVWMLDNNSPWYQVNSYRMSNINQGFVLLRIWLKFKNRKWNFLCCTTLWQSYLTKDGITLFFNLIIHIVQLRMEGCIILQICWAVGPQLFLEPSK